MKKKLLLFCCCVVLTAACGFSRAPEPAATSQPVPTVESTPSSESQEVNEEEKIEQFLQGCESVLSQYFGECYRVERYKFTFSVDVWQDGLSDGAAFAKAGEQSCIEGWEAMKDGILSMANGLITYKNSCGLENYHVVLSIMDDKNLGDPYAILLSYFDGRIMSDIVNDPE